MLFITILFTKMKYPQIYKQRYSDLTEWGIDAWQCGSCPDMTANTLDSITIWYIYELLLLQYCQIKMIDKVINETCCFIWFWDRTFAYCDIEENMTALAHLGVRESLWQINSVSGDRLLQYIVHICHCNKRLNIYIYI